MHSEEVLKQTLFDFLYRLVKGLLALSYILGAGSSMGQNLDSASQPYLLSEIQISASRLSGFSTGNKVLPIDSALIIESTDQSLADILSRHSPVYMRSYGLGGLATPSFRGSGASHTPVLWNGFNLQSPLNGQVDFSLIPAYLMEDVQLQFGGAGALFGSGAIGGVVHLNRPEGIQSGLSIGANLGFGSFGSRFQGLKFRYGKEDRWTCSLRAFHKSADNDFPYEDTGQPGSPTVKQSNASVEQVGILNDNRVRLGAGGILDLGIWFQNTDRQIPPTLTQAASSASQLDESVRVTAQYKQNWSKVNLTVRSALLWEDNEFRDPQISLISSNQSLAWLNEMELGSGFSGNYSWNLGAHWGNYQGDSDNLGGRVVQNRLAAFGSFNATTNSGKLNGIVSIRQELFDGTAAPLVPTLGLELVPSSSWRLKASMTRNYRLPTFNDLYWNDSFARGNSELEAESGWSQDLSLDYGKSINGFDISASVVAFHSRIKNWILWSPDTLGVWSPQNVLNVRSRGLEFGLDFAFQLGDVKINFSPKYNYVQSTNQEVRAGNESALDQQLIYVPEHNSQIYLSLRHFGSKISYDHRFISKTYTTTDNSAFLPGYDVGNLLLKTDLRFWRLDWSISGEIRNLWNKEYQVIAYRPMPGRNYQISLVLMFNK